jgi:hypothetical protein
VLPTARRAGEARATTTGASASIWAGDDEIVSSTPSAHGGVELPATLAASRAPLELCAHLRDGVVTGWSLRDGAENITAIRPVPTPPAPGAPSAATACVRSRLRPAGAESATTVQRRSLLVPGGDACAAAACARRTAAMFVRRRSSSVTTATQQHTPTRLRDDLHLGPLLGDGWSPAAEACTTEPELSTRRTAPAADDCRCPRPTAGRESATARSSATRRRGNTGESGAATPLHPGPVFAATASSRPTRGASRGAGRQPCLPQVTVSAGRGPVGTWRRGPAGSGRRANRPPPRSLSRSDPRLAAGRGGPRAARRRARGRAASREPGRVVL